jgi:potassium efflux system protein
MASSALDASVSGTLVVALVLAMIQTLSAQEAETARSSARRARASTDTFALEPAPQPITPDRLGSGTIEDLGVPGGRSRKGTASSSPVASPIVREGSSTTGSARSSASSEAIIDLKTIREETADRLKQMETSTTVTGAAGKEATTPRTSSAAIRQLLLERHQRLNEYDRAAQELRSLTDPKDSPERQAAAAHVELERLQAQLAQPPRELIPQVFATWTKDLTDSARGEMKDAIEAAKTELKVWQSKLESARVDQSAAGSTQQTLRTLRDRLFQQVATMKARGRERATAIDAAKSASVRQLEQERLVNLSLEAKVETLRLQAAEAKLAREMKLAEMRRIRQLELEAHVQLSLRLLEHMQLRYRDLAEAHQRDLEQAASRQASLARQLGDPLEQYRARRQADLLELEARVVKSEQTLATGTVPGLEEQRALADRAQADFAEIKQLLDDGNVSRLDALRLTNDFRRIGPERDRLLLNELASIEAQVQYYENSLTNVELELIEESLADQLEHDTVLERIAPERHQQAKSEFAEFEQKRRTLLARRKAALGGLVTRAAQTHEQVMRRLHILEDEYGFIRTHIFWVRDQEPIGVQTVAQAGREFRRLVKGLLKLVEEAGDRKQWRQPPSEFMTAAVAAVVLPLGLFRLRRLLRRRITRALPPSHLHGDLTEPVRVNMTPVIGRT